MAAALMCTIIVGEFVDLSVPAVFGFAATILPVLVVNHGWNVWLAGIVAVAATVAIGALQGFLLVRVRVNTIVVTLRMRTLLLGVSLGMSDLNTRTRLPASLSKIALSTVRA